MLLYDLLSALEPEFKPAKAKIHLARYNQIEQPIDVYKRGGFDEWQSWQNGNNFNRPLVVSLIQDGATTRWMFAGLFHQVGFTLHDDKPKGGYYYDLRRIASTESIEGRLFCSSVYKHRQTYLTGEYLVGDLTVIELLPEKISLGRFPGYKLVNITKQDLNLLIKHNTESWKTALSNVKGIYLITDTETGKLYVGKADGESGIWQRWSNYANTGHGHNKALMQELGLKATERQDDLRFSLLEIMDLQSAPGEIDRRESHWKNILLSRQYGYNRN
ncbi:GIY-YIG nuclease family protein [Xanthomonas campestris]|uniref:GIY-YIG nuclease family protein n=1 Tax=Xanthomonas campestris TaxID=339 RepID=UPI002AD40032|nr:GIY-YIG nuclease family protein [Xanthomonas campestris]MEA0681701.1 GIY-YIG nuclease family protein [Xanthomonas campestris pv. campestris]MEA0814368.1 GIY-YIG nuclease family protein [Xanthomonas campestris pv. campestris]MEB1326730.1 GIY-YIG nuclease family protein [Xanthomonas campestris pv. campestris]MEB1540480.1 GIY-YIG nuclease family protein [Xanthomonas campestris pv. campestris]MEB2197542.1 GIY-YIG nuclease family protein [Xanthomonas campestris pv. campestris]